MLYDNVQDATMRLNNSVVFYKDKPCFVEFPRDDFKARFYSLENNCGSHETENVNDAYDNGNMSFRHIPLGYVVSGRPDGLPIMVMRSTARRFKQGICPENTHGLYFDRIQPRIDQLNIGLFQSSLLHKTIMGDFTPFPIAYAQLKDKAISSAIVSRRVFLFRDELGIIKICYNGKVFGFFRNDENIMVPERLSLGIVGFKSEVLGYDFNYEMMEM